MCGLAGFVDFSCKSDKNILVKMTDALSHRGPDDSGYYFQDKKNYHIGLGHRRLSIIDLSNSGHQPMTFQQLTLVFNGEVYNYLDIRKELEFFGYQFESKSDTEVVLKSFHKWGVEAVNKFRGMFAFALWNSQSEKLLLFRDRIGVKPLYWYFHEGVFMFASELKSFSQSNLFKKNLNITALSSFLNFGVVNAPNCIFDNTYKVKSGHYIELDRNGKVNEFCYWDVKKYFLEGEETREIWVQKDENQIALELEELLTDSFNLRMIADVPIGIFLSGGIDSSLVTALLQKDRTNPLRTFTIGFHEKDFDESSAARSIANYLGTHHTELICSPKSAFDVIPMLPTLYDEPFGGPSAIPTYLVSQLASEQVKVSLSADAGDEQFFGYTRYLTTQAYTNKIERFPYSAVGSLFNIASNLPYFNTLHHSKLLPSNIALKYKRLKTYVRKCSYIEKYENLLHTFDASEIKKLGLDIKQSDHVYYDHDLQSLDRRSQMMYYDIKHYLPDNIMTKVDRASMGVSLEAREPLIDHKIIEYTSRLPHELKYKNNVSKYILKKILFKHIPEKMMDRPKKGFGVPIETWFKKDLKELYVAQLNRQKVDQQGIFNGKVVEDLLNTYLKSNVSRSHANKLWYLFTFSLWHDKHL